MKTTFKRIGAYIIDMFIILTIVTLFSKIEILNPSKEEYNEIMTEYKEVYNDYMTGITEGNTNMEENITKLNDLSYKVSKYSVPTTIINIFVSIVYFVLFAYLNKGQTIGKKILGIKVVDNKTGKKPSFIKILLRGIILYGYITSIASTLILALASKSTYLSSYTYLSFVETTLLLLSFAFILFREDTRGLHDLIAGTKVVNAKTIAEEIKEIK